jgi:hypothetical protein
MNDYRFTLTAPSAVQELRDLVQRLRGAIEQSVAGYGMVISRPADADDAEFSQDLLVRSRQGELEVAVQWQRADGQAAVAVAVPSSRGAAYLPLLLALLLGFVADKTPEILPILRGLRVMLGAVTGLVVGFALVAIMGALGFFKARRDPALQRNVQSAVREVMLARQSSAP